MANNSIESRQQEKEVQRKKAIKKRKGAARDSMGRPTVTQRGKQTFQQNYRVTWERIS